MKEAFKTNIAWSIFKFVVLIVLLTFFYYYILNLNIWFNDFSELNKNLDQIEKIIKKKESVLKTNNFLTGVTVISDLISIIIELFVKFKK